MTYLHNNKDLFNDAILAAAEYLHISPAIVEKDYFVTLLLKEIAKRCPDIIFKGGTSLSKCHKLIHRFSEDIDIGLNAEKATEGMRKKLKTAIVSAIESLSFTLDNPEQIYSRTYYNKYQIRYPIQQNSSLIKPFLYAETAVFMMPYPFETMQADSYLYRFLHEHSFHSVVEQFDLHPFTLHVQTAERTFIDKLFALGDYYLCGKTMGYSRHLYDLHKLFPVIAFDPAFYSLLHEVKAIRAADNACPSAKDGQDLKTLLLRIAETDYFKNDYNAVTTGLLFEAVSYEETKRTLEEIICKL